MEKRTSADEKQEAEYTPDVQKGANTVDHAHHPRPTTQASKTRRAWLIVMLLASAVSGCSFYDAGRTFIEQPLETIECLPECPSYTEPIVLRHPGTGMTVACGPYPYALYSSMAAGYRAERQQCVAQYQRQGYVRLAKAEAKSSR
jgi:hypothetical protein